MSTTESSSEYSNIDQLPVADLLLFMNQEDHKVAPAVKKALPQVEALIQAVLTGMKKGGRLFYIGAGTSGRLGIVDASECPPTFGIDHGVVVGLIAGGDGAIRKAVEFAEDDEEGAVKDLEKYQLNENDSVIGIAASGKTPYVIGGIRWARANKMTTGCVTCNKETPLASEAEFPVEVIVGPEFVTGSTRLKSGTAQKLILNLITTVLMIRLGKVKGNKMVDMQLSNNKLVDRGRRMIMEEMKVTYEEATELLEKYQSVRKVLES
jgi:N-acetylmuramic acid 6-phosphate etherase